jgi:hypothetical protein
MSSTLEVEIPKAYIIPQGWWNVLELLEVNNIEMNRLEKDTTLTVNTYTIKSYDTRKQAYEGHYSHYNVALDISEEKVSFFKGDYIIDTNQNGIRYLLETLEPQAPDSFFSWNFFDTILQQKESFSPYVWEDLAQELLRSNPKLQIAFNLKKTFNKEFADNWFAQLDWLHKQSENYEKAHLQYPIYKLF